MRILKIMLLVLSAVVILLCGIFSDLHLGDEVIHYRLAQYIYQLNYWPTFDPLNQSYGNQKLYYIDPMLWHTFLAAIWKITGGICKITAQFYQALYFVVLILGLYILSKELYDEKTAFYSCLILGTIPIIPALSIILHTDIPVTALVISTLAFLMRRSFITAGIIAGLAFLTKRTAYFYIPVFLIFVLINLQGNIKKKAASLALFLIPLIIIASIGYFQHKIMQSLMTMAPPADNLQLKLNPEIKFVLKDIFDLNKNIFLAPFFIGIGFIVSIAAYFLNNNRTKKDTVIWMSIIMFSVIFLKYFHGKLLLRYAIIILPLFSIIAGRGLINIKSKAFRHTLVIICIFQFICASFYTMLNRRIPKETKETYGYIKLNTPYNSRIMSSRPDPQLYAQRPTIWNNYLALAEMPYLFWQADEKEMLIIFNKYGIDYLLIEKNRIYDDKITVKHQLGWPLSFVNKIPDYSCLTLIINNKYLSLWQVKR